MGWTGNTPRPTVLAVYYPHWHRYDHGEAWKGTGWTEWDGLQAAVPRFAGHHQPLEPSWGPFDEADPAWAAREIDLAADHGIDVFFYDWYWYSGVRNMEEALEEGFLQAPNRGRLKFCLMWANHDRLDQFCPPHDARRTNWLPSRHSPQDLERVIDYCAERYFAQPNYWQVAGRLYLSVYQGRRLLLELGGPEATRRIFERIDSRLAAGGLPPLHWNAITASAADLPELAAAGFASCGSYNVNTGGAVRADGTEPYEAVMAQHERVWASLSAGELPYTPVAAVGWDASPRCRAEEPFPFAKIAGQYSYPYYWVVVGNTPERYEELLRAAARHLDQTPVRAPGLLLYAWNEWTEGAYLLPERRTGTGYLEAVRKVFGRADD